MTSTVLKLDDYVSEFLIILAETKFYEYEISANIRGNNDVESILLIINNCYNFKILESE